MTVEISLIKSYFFENRVQGFVSQHGVEQSSSRLFVWALLAACYIVLLVQKLYVGFALLGFFQSAPLLCFCGFLFTLWNLHTDVENSCIHLISIHALCINTSAPYHANYWVAWHMHLYLKVTCDCILMERFSCFIKEFIFLFFKSWKTKWNTHTHTKKKVVNICTHWYIFSQFAVKKMKFSVKLLWSLQLFRR